MYRFNIATIRSRTGEVITLSSADYKNANEARRAFNGLVSYYYQLKYNVRLISINKALVKLNDNVLKTIEIEEVTK